MQNRVSKLGLQRRTSSSRRDILVPDRAPDLHTPLVMSSTNPLGKGARGASTRGLPSGRQKTSINADLPTDLLMEAGLKTAATAGSKAGIGSKPRIPLPKRGGSLGPARLKTSTQAMMESSGGVKGLLGQTRATPTAGDSIAFSKRSSATGGMKSFQNEDDFGKLRPSTEFLPSASQEFGEKVKQGRLRPNRQKSKSN